MNNKHADKKGVKLIDTNPGKEPKGSLLHSFIPVNRRVLINMRANQIESFIINSNG
jgi:hypothetical protein